MTTPDPFQHNKTPIPILDRTLFDNRFVKFVCRTFFKIVFRLFNWRVAPLVPEGCGVTIAAPHTSNWDIFYALGAALHYDAKIYFSIKEDWCRVPLLGFFIRYMGAIPIDRSSNANGQVDKIKAFVARNKHQRVFFLITPEGTRGKVEKWRSGFYHVAKDCELPIFLAKVDYAKKETGVFHTFHLTDDKAKDIASIQASYTSVCAKYPKNQYPPYSGPLPRLNLLEERIVTALYELKGKATRAEIIARSKIDSLTTEMLEFLVDKGLLETVNKYSSNNEVSSCYQLTLLGNGAFLHLQSS
ncbi:MAG: 1-acyl-sn-glycerol-3-phosphate acyltransferase [Pseudomonadota bacterium]